MRIIASLATSLLLLAGSALGGINGTYKVTGAETDHGRKYTFTGNVRIENGKTIKYALLFNDGDKSSFSATFKKKLKEVKGKQTVACASPLGTGTATFTYLAKQKKYKVAFTYKSKNGKVKGSGTGSKKA